MHIELPQFPIAGGCQCGQVRYRLTAPPIMFYVCHCTECQRQSASAFGESMWVKAPDLETAGKMRTFSRGTDSRSRLDCTFCPECGVRLFHRLADETDEITLKAGTLENTTWLIPAGHIWTGSKQSWIAIEPGSLAYRGQPDDGFAALERRWREMIART